MGHFSAAAFSSAVPLPLIHPRSRRAMKFHAVSCLTQETDARRAGTALGRRIAEGFATERLKAVLVYATVNYDQSALVGAVREAVGRAVAVAGCSAQGVMGNGAVDEGGFAAAAMGLGGDGLKVAAAGAQDIQVDTAAKGRTLARTLREQLGGPVRLMIAHYDPLCGIDVNELLAGVRHDNPSTVVGAAAGQPAGPAAATYQYLGGDAFA